MVSSQLDFLIRLLSACAAFALGVPHASALPIASTSGGSIDWSDFPLVLARL